jgi:sigma-B regulation protein RsbU (phosphoserine phosphatase)
MTKGKHFHIKNEMLLANFLANFIGVFGVSGLLFMAEGSRNRVIWTHALPFWIDTLFSPFAFTFVCVMTLIYERPIRQYLNILVQETAIPLNLEIQARRRLLNEPFVLIALDFSMWLLAAIVYPLLLWIYGSGPRLVAGALTNSLSIGLITVTIAFFLLEHVLQKRLAPLFFPNGGLTMIPKTVRIRIRTRLAALLLACNLIPLISILMIFQRITSTPQDPSATIQQLRSAVFIYALTFLGVGIGLTMLVSRNLTIPFKEIVQTLRGVRNGDFGKKVRVSSNDEIGYTGDVINEMTKGLIERDRMRQSLGIAMEVQQNLLPATDPKVIGLDIAGTSIYCEETGGDYYDYLNVDPDGRGKIQIVVGDVSDHGIASALLMTSARAFLRQRASRSGMLDQMVADVNQQISRDVEESGRFMTLFFCEIDSQSKTIRWVNAGHEPAIIYDPNNGRMEELTGHGLPLGVAEKTFYQESRREFLPGQILLIGTDGIRESQNSEGQMFGKKRLQEVIRSHGRESAKDLLHAIITELDKFCHPLQKEDDVTLVVVKVAP